MKWAWDILNHIFKPSPSMTDFMVSSRWVNFLPFFSQIIDRVENYRNCCSQLLNVRGRYRIFIQFWHQCITLQLILFVIKTWTEKLQNVEFCICETILAFNIYICHSRMWNSILFDCRTHPKRLLMKSCYKVAVEFNKANAMRQNSEI